MIEKVYIINEAGVAIYSRSYKKTLQDDDLMISGFLIAISQFAKQLTKSGAVEEIKLADILFKYKRIKNLTVIFRVSGMENDKDLDHKLSQVGNSFIKKFGPKIDFWNGNLEIFEPFTDKLDEIIQTQNEQIVLEIIDIIDEQIRKENKDIQQYLDYLKEFEVRIENIHLKNDYLQNSINEWKENIVKSKFSIFSNADFDKFKTKFEEWKSIALKEHKDKIMEKLDALTF
ncbi:MAG: hypothetical protein ACTSVY_04815 [Candidatus Helarchaeota archaeon]